MPIKNLPGWRQPLFLHFSSAAGAFTHLQERHQGKPSLIKRLNGAGLTAE
jgi:hypothetical protein